MSNSTNQKIQTYCLAVIAVAVLTYMVYWLRPVLVPFVVALFVVSGVTPVLETVERIFRVNRLIASVIAFVAGLCILFLLSICLWGSVQQLASQGTAYRERVNELLTSAQRWLPARFLPGSASISIQEAGADNGVDSSETLLKPKNTDSEAGSDEIVSNKTELDGNELNAGEPNGTTQREALSDDAAADYTSFRDAIDGFMRRGLGQVTSALLEFFSTSVVVLIYVFFILLGSENTAKASASIRAVDQQVRSYLFLKTVISILTGLVFGAALWIFGVPMALTFGLLAFLLNYIPNIGPVVASLLPIPFILLSPDGSILWMIAAIAVTMSIQIVSGSVVEPKVMGNSSDLHPVVILLALMFWGMMWGITGMFLATPITAGIKIVMEGYDATRPLASLMAGRFEKTQVDAGQDHSSFA